MPNQLPQAVWEGTLRLFGVDVRCALLDDGTRVIDAESIEELFRNGEPAEFFEVEKELELNGDILIDGQHRLHVVRGVESDAFDTLDQGKRRSVGQMFARDGEKNYAALASACKFIHHYQTGTVRALTSKTAITPTMAWTILKANVGLRDSLDFVTAIRSRDYMSHGISAALHYLMKQKFEEDANLFWTQLCTGENLTKTMPVYLLRQRLIANGKAQGKLRQHVISAFVVKAWNATRMNEKLGVIKWNDDEDFPEIK